MTVSLDMTVTLANICFFGWTNYNYQKKKSGQIHAFVME